MDMHTHAYIKTHVHLLSGPRLLPWTQLPVDTPVTLQRRLFGRVGQRGKPVGASDDGEPKAEEPKPARRSKKNETPLTL